MPSVKKPKLDLALLQDAARDFALTETEHKSLYGVSDGKAVGTYVEHSFREYLEARFVFTPGNSAEGIDLPEIGVDFKVTRTSQPQSSCPFKSARQKIYGLGYGVLVFVYEKRDNPKRKTGRLDFRHVVFVEKEQTADFQMTTSLLRIVENNGNRDDILAFFEDKNLPCSDIEARNLADEVIMNPPAVGYLTISNALQWRLQYARAIEKAGSVEGVRRVV